MKTYLITLLTPSGVKTEIYKDSQDLEEFTAEMATKYGTFVTLKSELK